MAKIMTTGLLPRKAPRERTTRASVDEELDEELDQGPGVLTNLHAFAAETARVQGLLSQAEPVRGQSAPGR